MGLVIDTSALIEFERALADGRELDFDRDEIAVIPAIVWAEGLVGVQLARGRREAKERLERLELLGAKASVAPFTADTARQYAAIFASLSAQRAAHSRQRHVGLSHGAGVGFWCAGWTGR